VRNPATTAGKQTVDRQKPWWQQTWAIVSAAVAIVGAITGVISVWPLIFRDATTLDSLVLSVEPADSQLAPVFAVPVGSDWVSFPTSTSVCDAAQLAWLEANGTRLAERFLVSVTNSAHEGALMSLKEFRGVGSVVAGPPTHVAVVCDQTGAGTSNIRAAGLDPGADGVAAFQQADPTLPDDPLVFTLAPGENGQFALSVRSSAAFSGTIAFTAAVGTETRQVELPIDTLELPAVAPIGFVIIDGVLACDVPNCDPTTALARLG
jgi:hypothetical protein